jgi:hypothetical protein
MHEVAESTRPAAEPGTAVDRTRIWLVIGALLLDMLLAAPDQTIVCTAPDDRGRPRRAGPAVVGGDRLPGGLDGDDAAVGRVGDLYGRTRRRRSSRSPLGAAPRRIRPRGTARGRGHDCERAVARPPRKLLPYSADVQPLPRSLTGRGRKVLTDVHVRGRLAEQECTASRNAQREGDRDRS